MHDGIAVIALAELLEGVHRLPEGRRRAVLGSRIDTALQPYRGRSAVLASDDEAAEHYAVLLVAREQAGLPISTADAQIAAICRSHGAVCATRNVEDFELTGVKLTDLNTPTLSDSAQHTGRRRPGSGR